MLWSRNFGFESRPCPFFLFVGISCTYQHIKKKQSCKRIFKVWSLFLFRFLFPFFIFLFFYFLFFYFFIYFFIFLFIFLFFYFFLFNLTFLIFNLFFIFLFLIFNFFIFFIFLLFYYLFFIFSMTSSPTPPSTLFCPSPTHPSLFLSCLPPPTPP